MKKSDRTQYAKEMSAKGAAKGGRARASVLTDKERSEIAKHAAEKRWEKAGKLKEKPVIPTSEHRSASEMEVVEVPQQGNDQAEQSLPFAMFSGELTIGDTIIPCHVLNDARRVLHQRAMVNALGMKRGGSSRGGGDRLAYFVDQKRLKPFVTDDLLSVTKTPLTFKMLTGPIAYGYEAIVLADICDAVLAAHQAGALQEQQAHIADQCLLLMRGFARAGIDALVDEATGYDKVKKKRDYQIKLQAFIADELQEWAVMFPDEFWWELARLEGVHYSARHRPLRWGRYVMMFVYDAIDPDIGNWLRENNPGPCFKKNHHQWLKEFGRDQVDKQITKVVTIMKLCRDMADFRAKFDHVFKKSPLQMTFDDINWEI
jgi:hypothetical protein